VTTTSWREPSVGGHAIECAKDFGTKNNEIEVGVNRGGLRQRAERGLRRIEFALVDEEMLRLRATGARKRAFAMTISKKDFGEIAVYGQSEAATRPTRSHVRRGISGRVVSFNDSLDVKAERT